MSVFGVILVRIFPHSVRMRENTNQNNSEYGHLSRSESIHQYTPRTPNDISIYGCREI